MTTSLGRHRQVNYTDLAIKAKDLDLTGDVDVTGNAAVGGTLAITGALTGTGGLKLAPVALAADDTTIAVSASDSGKLHVVPDVDATSTITLPAAAAGLTFEFMYGGAAADAHDHVFVPTAGFFIGGVVFHDQDGDVSAPVFSDNDSNDVFTIVTPDNYWIKFVSDGTNWYLNGYVHSATVCTIADS
jgi:hypothetical protein